MPLFYSTYEIIPDKRSDCLTLFGGMSEEDDKKDVGEDIKIYGRWGSPGEGTGVCVYEAPDSKTVANWLQNWIEMGTVRAGDGGAARPVPTRRARLTRAPLRISRSRRPWSSTTTPAGRSCSRARSPSSSSTPRST